MAKVLTTYTDQISLNSNAGITNTLEEAEKTTSTVIYGDMAYRTNSYLAVDTVDGALLKREYRKPYTHPYSM